MNESYVRCLYTNFAGKFNEYNKEQPTIMTLGMEISFFYLVCLFDILCFIYLSKFVDNKNNGRKTFNFPAKQVTFRYIRFYHKKFLENLKFSSSLVRKAKAINANVYNCTCLDLKPNLLKKNSFIGS